MQGVGEVVEGLDEVGGQGVQLGEGGEGGGCGTRHGVGKGEEEGE